MVELQTLDLRRPGTWKAWLARHHASSPGVWLVFHKKHTGVRCIPYDDAVREALCVGWIDSLVKRLDDDRYVRKFTPRRSTSVWSDINRVRWTELKEAGRLRKAGLAASPSGRGYAPTPSMPKLPSYIATALKRQPRAWRFFQSLAPTYRRHFVGWIDTAKRPETREKRLRESIAFLMAGKRLGLK